MWSITKAEVEKNCFCAPNTSRRTHARRRGMRKQDVHAKMFPRYRESKLSSPDRGKYRSLMYICRLAYDVDITRKNLKKLDFTLRTEQRLRFGFTCKVKSGSLDTFGRLRKSKPYTKKVVYKKVALEWPKP